MEARAQARYARVTPRKARRVVDLIRGLPAADARAVLQFAPQAASEPVGKVLASAIANAEHNSQLDTDTLFVSRAWVDEGPTLKRFRPRMGGRAYRINKRTCHITVIVESRPEPVAAAPSGRRSGGATARKSPAKAPAKAKADKAPAKASGKSAAKSSDKSAAKASAKSAGGSDTGGKKTTGRAR